MKKFKELNDVNTSKYKLKPGEVKVFRILNMKRDPRNPGVIIIPTLVSVPARDTIMDGNEPKDIACIKSIGRNGSISYHSLWFTKESAGSLVLHGGRIADQEMYEYLMLSNYRKGNPNRDQSKREIYELVDNTEKAKELRATRGEKLKAMKFADEMTDEDVMTFAAASGWTDKDIDIVRDKIESMAENDPIGFMKIAGNRQNNIKADVQRAIEMGFVNWDKSAHKFTWSSNDELITSVPRSTKGDHLDGILNFILNTEHGDSVYKEIKLLLNGDVVEHNTESAEKQLTTAKKTKPFVTKK